MLKKKIIPGKPGLRTYHTPDQGGDGTQSPEPHKNANIHHCSDNQSVMRPPSACSRDLDDLQGFSRTRSALPLFLELSPAHPVCPSGPAMYPAAHCFAWSWSYSFASVAGLTSEALLQPSTNPQKPPSSLPYYASPHRDSHFYPLPTSASLASLTLCSHSVTYIHTYM